MKPNYKALAAYYRKRFLEEGRAAALLEARCKSLELRCKMADAVYKRYLEENEGLRERIAQLEAEQWTKSQTV